MIKIDSVDRPPTADARTEYNSVVAPVLGREAFSVCISQQLPELRRRYQGRLRALKRAGWPAVQGKKLVYAMNCPSCCARVAARRRVCSLPICPFCFGRKVSRISRRVYRLAKQYGGRVATYRTSFGTFFDDRVPIGFDSNGQLQDIQQILAEERAHQRRVRRMFREALGGYYWYTLAPSARYHHKDLYDAGRWVRMRSCVAVMPGDWYEELPLTRMLDALSPFNLAGQVGNTFIYRRTWLSCLPIVMSTLLTMTRGNRFCTPFGYFKNGRTSY
jgi:hypothetical protein